MDPRPSTRGWSVSDFSKKFSIISADGNNGRTRAKWGERSCRFSGGDQTNMFVTFQVFMIHVWVLNNLSTRHGPMIYGVHLSRAIHPARYLVHHPPGSPGQPPYTRIGVPPQIRHAPGHPRPLNTWHHIRRRTASRSTAEIILAFKKLVRLLRKCERNNVNKLICD